MRRSGRLLLLALLAGCLARPVPKPRIVASTTLISTIIREVAGDRFAVTTIAPAGLCPGHFDLKPSDITAVNGAKLLLSHGWEPWYPALEKAIVPPGPHRVILRTKGNWMVPSVHAAATAELTSLLCQLDPSDSARYQANARRYLAQVESVSAIVKGLFPNRNLPAVIASDNQAPFLEWLGFRVVARYGRPEEFTAQELSRLAQLMVDSSVGLVVDNLQSGPDAGKPLAEAAQARHVTLTNFPLTGSYLESLLANGRALAQALP